MQDKLRHVVQHVFDRELFVQFHQEDKLEKHKFRNLSSMRI